jgi:hypothetical protein
MNKCRLCAGPTKQVWRHMILGKYDVGYFECDICGSLQTDEPYWLEEAYADSGTGFDTGACQRSFDCTLAMSAALELIGFPRNSECLDYGAGTGIYARMMRDRGWSYFAHEKYASPYYMDKFRAEPEDKKWAMISAFEVFEHLPTPSETFDLILGSAKDYVFFTTDLWERQGHDWVYLTPIQGHHIFFYTRRALEMAALKYCYEFHDLGFVKCFARPDSREKLSLLKRPDFGQQILHAFLRHQQNPYQYAARDHADLVRSRNDAMR